MSNSALKDFLAETRRVLFDEDWAAMEQMFTFPVVVYSAAGVVVVESFDMMKSMSASYVTALRELDIQSGHHLIIDQTKLVNQRMRVTAQWVELDGQNKVVAGSRIRYFLVEDGAGRFPFRIEMLEYLEAPLPTSDIEQIIH